MGPVKLVPSIPSRIRSIIGIHVAALPNTVATELVVILKAYA